MKTLTDIQIIQALQEKAQMHENAVLEKKRQIENERRARNDALLKSYHESNIHLTRASKLSNLRSNIKAELMEAALDTIFDKCFADNCYNKDELDDAFNDSIITNFISDEGIEHLLDRFESKTYMLSELALLIKETADKAVEDLDIDNVDSYVVNPELKQNLIDNIKGNEDIEDIADSIRFKVSRATEDFIHKNIVDKLNIKDIMLTTKEKLDDIKSGDDVLDQEIKQEQTLALKRRIREINNRPHSIFEQMVINTTEAILKNDELRNVFTLESGKIDMDKIVKRVTSYYTFLEMVNTMKMVDNIEKYIEEALAIK